MQKIQKLFNNRKVFYSVIVVLALLFGVFSFLTIKSYSNKEEPKSKEKVLERETFTTYISDGNGHYKKYTSADGSLYPSGYAYNQGMSYCEDLDGNRLDIVPTYSNNKFTLESDKTAFCYLYFDILKSFAEELITSGELWQSGLEGDGYRYTGTGITCSYDDGNYIIAADNQDTTPSCQVLYKYTRTTISNGATTNYTYNTYCPSNDSTYTYSCTELAGTLVDSSNVPNNFICFGTTDKTECKNNEAKYMYRIIGVFLDSTGKEHLKLISFKQLISANWNNSFSDIDWGSSTLFTSLNGSGFLTNSTYDYLQNSTWLDKVENWKWTAVNTQTDEIGGPNYYNNLSPSEIYLHEMNRSSKSSNLGVWTTPNAKIGLMYVSDYVLSLGGSALSMTTGTYTNRATLKTGWLHQSNNDETKSTDEWVVSRYGEFAGDYRAWGVHTIGVVDFEDLNFRRGVRPVFYLTSDVTYKSGTGTYADPYIIG